ncbi:hypothetical protein MSG28_004182 [Choristoneura fumiferana]|uniref:Uncharacterized protein n=1 Tax=Choristoneura fumiferana TaxID=7141 RepID=A0ACC0KIJ4_CHOFU|nr:hypothetical protein MSG28_004182 [Choristoneura fumiferana]
MSSTFHDLVESILLYSAVGQGHWSGAPHSYGSVLNLRGEVEMEASIMCGKSLDVGAVTLVKDFLHPISIAHKVLTESPHSLLGAEGAKIFALEKGFETVPPESLITQQAKDALQNFLKHGEFGRTEIGLQDEGGVGTVGAVAVDAGGHVAVATSTGGMSGKAVGRIGDTPQIGSGTYADDKVGGVSTTDEVSNYSKKCVKEGFTEIKFETREAVVREVNEKILNLIQRWKEKQDSSTSFNNPEKDTWVFPLIQMGEYEIRQDERVTQGMLGSAPPDSLIRLATGYFNLTGEYADTLLKDCKANISLLMAHPNVLPPGQRSSVGDARGFSQPGIPSVDGESDVTRRDSQRCDQPHRPVSHRVEVQQRIGQMRRQQRVDAARSPCQAHVEREMQPAGVHDAVCEEAPQLASAVGPVDQRRVHRHRACRRRHAARAPCVPREHAQLKNLGDLLEEFVLLVHALTQPISDPTKWKFLSLLRCKEPVLYFVIEAYRLAGVELVAAASEDGKYGMVVDGIVDTCFQYHSNRDSVVNQARRGRRRSRAWAPTVTGGTYFPPEDRWGRPGFKSILLSLAKKWKENKDQFNQAGAAIMDALQNISKVDNELSPSVPGEETWNKCVQKYISAFEPDFGGFGLAPKFPQCSIFNFLFHFYARDKSDPEGKQCLEMCLHTLTKMAKGGIHDHISSGFARYSVDNDWHVPHFEKMLYDQAQLVTAYTDAFIATKDDFYAEVVRDIIKYVNRDLRHESGGYYSAEDADSYPVHGATHKKEGAFCVWEYDEIESLVGDKKINEIAYMDIICDYFSIDEGGNISPESDPHGELAKKNVLIVYGSKEETAKKFDLTIEKFNQVLTECTEILYKARLERPRPHLDSKMLCSWNALMISGLAQAGQGLGEKDYVEDAIKTANFIKQAKPIRGFLDDYAFLVRSLLDLYEASLDLRWLNWARELQQKQDELFWDNDNGGYFTCSDDDSTVVLRLKGEQDGAEPAGNSVACHNLLRLAAYADKSAVESGGDHEREMAKKLLTAFSRRLIENPTALPEMMSALMFYNDSPTQVLIAGGCNDPRTLELVRVVRSRLLPGRVLAVADPAADSPAGMSDILLSRIRSVGDAPTAYVCRRYACSLPVTDVKQLENLLDEATVPPSKPN